MTQQSPPGSPSNTPPSSPSPPPKDGNQTNPSNDDNTNNNDNDNRNVPDSSSKNNNNDTINSDNVEENKKKDNTDNSNNTSDTNKTSDKNQNKKRKRLKKQMVPRKKPKDNQKDNNEPPKTSTIIISLYDLLNMDENNMANPFTEPEETNKEYYNPGNRIPYNYDEEASLGEYEPMEIEEYLNLELNNIDDFIKIGEDYIAAKYDPYKKYNINVYTISKLVKPLKKLQNMIGMENVKQDVFELLLYQLQEFDNSKDMLHTIIEGEPGVGKTDLAKIMAEIYQKMGYCKNEIVKFVKRSDLIGGYLGQTAIKTQKVLDECKGGILVIDEAYSLGSPEGRDSYSKECIDTLTSFLSESPETIVFIMGYHDDLEKSLFAMNKGLERRFSYRFTVRKYNPAELRRILFKIIRQQGWDVEKEDEIPVEFFETNEKFFIFNGGDMLNLFTKCKFTHAKRFFHQNKKSTCQKNIEHLKKKINFTDIKKAFKLLKKDEKFKNRNNNNSKIFESTFYT